MKSVFRKNPLLNRLGIRQLKKRAGAFLTLFAIFALSSCLCAGLRQAAPALVNSMNHFYQDNALYDLRLRSSIEWDEDAIEQFAGKKDVASAEGARRGVVILENEDGEMAVYTAQSLTKKVNKVILREGKMPKKKNECLIDATHRGGCHIGDKVKVSKKNESDVRALYAAKEWTVTGFADSSLYVMKERGTAAVGNGVMTGFVYLPAEAFTADTYRDIYVKLADNTRIFSDEYEKYFEEKVAGWSEEVQANAQARADKLLAQAQKELAAAKKEMKDKTAARKKKLKAEGEVLDEERSVLEAAMSQVSAEAEAIEADARALEDQAAQVEAKREALSTSGLSNKKRAEKRRKAYEDAKSEYEKARASIESRRSANSAQMYALSQSQAEYNEKRAKFVNRETALNKVIKRIQKKIDKAQEKVDNIHTPVTHILGRDDNKSYAALEADADNLRQLTGVLPLLFMLSAGFISMLILARLIRAQRGQFGLLRSLGCTDKELIVPSMVASGVPAFAGTLIGYAAGVFLFPALIRRAYRAQYIDIHINHVVNPLLLVLMCLFALACALGTTFLMCRRMLSESTAALMKPAPEKSGGNIFLDYIPAVWEELSLKHKAVLRGVFLDKKRMLIMILGAAGCMAMLTAGFGIKHSVGAYAKNEFNDIRIADAEVSCDRGRASKLPAKVRSTTSKTGCGVLAYVHQDWNLAKAGKDAGVELLAPYDLKRRINRFFILMDTQGKALGVPEEGDAIVSVGLAKRYHIKKGDKITLENADKASMKVRVSGVFENYAGRYVIISPKTLRAAVGRASVNGFFVNFPAEADVYQMQTNLAQLKEVKSVTLLQDKKKELQTKLAQMRYVAWMMIIGAMILAFALFYHMNRNAYEQRRGQFDRLSSLGMIPGEITGIVTEEHFLLTAAGIIAGIFLGIGLYAVSMIPLSHNAVYFPVRVGILSVLLSVVLTAALAMLAGAVIKVRSRAGRTYENR